MQYNDAAIGAFLVKQFKGSCKNVANTAIRVFIVGTSKGTTQSKALTAKLQAMAANSTENAIIVVNIATGKKSVTSKWQKCLQVL